MFDALAALGEQLVAWHLLEHADATKIVASHARSTSAIAYFGTDYSLQKVAEKGKTLAEVSGYAGKVYVNDTSGFANVHQGVWQNTIGGYQVLHKWLDDRRKAKRSLSQDDITHWLRVYAALEATQKLMLQVDVAIEANGGWPGAFSQNHPPPDAATLALEQMAQKEQLRAQKKVATAAKKEAAHDQAMRTRGLFDPDDDLDEMAAASGAPPRPKSRATPVKAAGGAADITNWNAMCAIRAVMTREGALARADLIRHTAWELGFTRTGPRIAKALESAIRLATKRGIASNERGTLSLVASKIDGYDRDFLKQHLLSCITKAWCDKAEVPLRFARELGFARTGPTIEETVWSLMRALQRGELVQTEGRGVNTRYRTIPR
jgi:Type ISP C-terminal specificity domain